jgi:O-antigen/teichoic acid export membrane protein
VLKRNILSNYLGQGWAAFMGLAFVPLYIRFLGIEAWGLVGFMAMLQTWMALLDMGLSPALSREMSRFKAGATNEIYIRSLVRAMEVIYFVAATTVAVLFWIGSKWISEDWLSSSRIPTRVVETAIQIIGLVIAMRMVEQVYRSALQGLQKQVWINVLQALIATIRWGGAAIALMYLGAGIKEFFLWQVAASMLSAICLAIKFYSVLPGNEKRGQAVFNWKSINMLRNSIGGLGVVAFLSIFLTQTDKLILSKLISLEDFGYYTIATTITAGLYLIVTPLVSGLSPHLTELVARNKIDEVVKEYHRYSEYMSTLLMPVALVLSIFSESVLFVWTGNLVLAQKTAPLLTVLSLGTMCNGLMNIPYATQVAYGWTKLAIKLNLIALILIIPLIFTLVDQFGAIGGAFSWLILNAGYLIFGINLMHKEILVNEKVKWYKNSLIRPIIFTTVITFSIKYLIDIPYSRFQAFLYLAIITITLVCILFLTGHEGKFSLNKIKR